MPIPAIPHINQKDPELRKTLQAMKERIEKIPDTTNVGTVTSISGTGGSTGLTFTGFPITTVGTFQLGGILNVLNGGTGVSNPQIKAGSGVSIAGTWPNYTISATGSGGTVTSVNASGGTTGLTFSGGPISTSGTLTLGGTLAVANGGTGTATPSLVAGTNISITGTWPNQTVTNTGPTGTVTSVSVTTANGVSGSVANSTTTPAITLTLGAITPTTVNGLTISTSTGTLTVANGKTATLSNSITFTGTDSTTMTFPPASASLGYIGLPQNSQSAAYTTVLSDAGKHIFHPSSDVTARTFTIDSNANVPYPIGTSLTFINQNGAGVITISITSDTMRLAGPGTTGNRTLAANGMATAVKIATTEWIISGAGLT